MQPWSMHDGQQMHKDLFKQAPAQALHEVQRESMQLQHGLHRHLNEQQLAFLTSASTDGIPQQQLHLQQLGRHLPHASAMHVLNNPQIALHLQ